MELEAGFTEHDVRTIAAPGSYDRARDYSDAVTNLAVEPDRVTAIVHGSALYLVRIIIRPQLDGQCDCPHGAEGNFCKHCVAVALAFLREFDAAPAADRPAADGPSADGPPPVDVDTAVARRAADLAPDGSTHLEIARLLDTAGRNAQALDWAERGLRSATPAHDQLVDYVVRRYQAEGRVPDAIALRRAHLAAVPSLRSYQRLRADATAAGCWADERQAALDVLGKVRKPASGWHGTSGAPVVDALIDDGDIEMAWQAAADWASEEQWLRLADLIGERRPADALEIYLRRIEPLRELTGNESYINLARLLVKARECHRRLGTEAEFRRYLAHLRTQLKRRHNLLTTLDRYGL